jgi:hypothetical protein
MILKLTPRSQRASSNFWVPIRQEMVGTPGSSILSGRSSRIAALYGSGCVSLMSLGEAFVGSHKTTILCANMMSKCMK